MVLVSNVVPLIVKLPLSSSLESPLLVNENVSELLDVSESTADSVPMTLPMDEVSEIVLEVKFILVGGIKGAINAL